MFDLTLNEDEIEWLRSRYVGLRVQDKNGYVSVHGALEFSAMHEGVELQDTFRILIEFRESKRTNLPKVYETGGRTKRLSKETSTSLADLHVVEDGSACLCAKPEEGSYFPEGFDVYVFIEGLVVPYFYALTYFEQYHRWPWPTRSHGVVGWLEWYFEQRDVTKNTLSEFIGELRSTSAWHRVHSELVSNEMVRANHPCICGSGDEYSKCHPTAFVAMWKLQNDVRRFSILERCDGH